MTNEKTQSRTIEKMNVTIVGIGLIGGSLAMAIKELNPQNLWAVDNNDRVRELVTASGVADEVFADPAVPLGKSDLVIVCLYPQAMANFMEKYNDNFKPGALITDVAGIKTSVLAKINSFLRSDIDFVGGHPMAGKEVWGFSNASTDIFIGANYILTPTSKNKQQNISFLEKLFGDIGFASVTSISPDYHDEIVALTSQLPHVISVSMANCIYTDEISKFVGGSFRDYTRVALINSELWAELFMVNKDKLLQQIDLFQSNMDKIKEAIVGQDKKRLQEIMEEGARKREVLF